MATSLATGLLFLLTTAGATTALAQSKEADLDQETLPLEEKVIEEPAWVPSDSTVMDEVWFFFVEEPQEQMKSTIQHLTDKEQEEASHTVLTTAAYLRLETVRARGKELSELQSAIGELDKLAEEIDIGKVTKPDQVAKPFDDALLALARFHYGQAQRALARVDRREFGKELKATAIMLDYGLNRNEGGLDDAQIADLTQAQSAADSLMASSDARPENSYTGIMRRLKTDINLLARLSRQA
jgi:hypothetical protein